MKAIALINQKGRGGETNPKRFKQHGSEGLLREWI